jgi:hypothetical protein
MKTFIGQPKLAKTSFALLFSVTYVNPLDDPEHSKK